MKSAILLSKIKERSFSANIESLWNTKTWGTPVQLAFLMVNFLLREEHGVSIWVSIWVAFAAARS
jgi:hypothetical protein